MPPGRQLTSLLQAGDVHAALASFYNHTPPAVSHLNDIVAVSGKGTHVFTAGGDSYLDMTSGIGVVSTGHCHVRVVHAVQAQAAKLVHAQQNIFGAHEAGISLIDRLLQIMPSASRPENVINKFFFTNSGSEAIDNAIKVARGHTGKPNIIAFEGGFHGRTYGAMACTSSKTIYRQGFGPVMPGVFIAPYPACLHCKASSDQEYPLPPDTQHTMVKPRSCCNGPLEAVEWMLKMQTAPQETAGIIVEPILGEGGIITPPPGFLLGLRKLCDKHGMLLILDEVRVILLRHLLLHQLCHFYACWISRLGGMQVWAHTLMTTDLHHQSKR
ncbi:pyridoxal phosphate-dependent transferase [Dunaliella salina]|uniref:Pyridoxal phosphate-dependent transferase n=1 Tax=Dunaliella salina TaxID=3046 RepID=A0ABQ7FZU4_DUNSA|nr:pyridoxal phosphate-dependent transferase [Dunaliella salina]|eukprot:KAF5827870.1 pyridoxal phosphate-dependent transferase [Dunaliella salina]